MNMLLLTENDLVGPGSAQVTGRRAKHMLSVLQVRPGDRVNAGLLNGPAGEAEVLSLSRETVDVRLHLAETAPPRPTTWVVLAMVRPQIMKRTLMHLASLGTRAIMLTGSERVEKQYFGQRLFDREGGGYLEHLLLGLEQAGDTWLPQLSIHRSLKKLLVHELKTHVPRGAVRLVAHPHGVPVTNDLDRGTERVIAIGPEGGWVPGEVELFTESGFTPFSLGERILKVETAIPYVFGRLGL